MGNLFGGGCGCNEDNSWWILIVIAILFLCNGNNGLFGNNCNNTCDPCENNNDWTWILIVIAILFLCNGNNGIFGNNCDCKKPC